jgi:hypothetical protein
VTEIHRYAPSGTERRAATTNAVWSSIMAVLYDPLPWLGDRASAGHWTGISMSTARKLLRANSAPAPAQTSSMTTPAAAPSPRYP